MRELLFNVLLNNEVGKFIVTLPKKLELNTFRTFINSNFDQFTIAEITKQSEQHEQYDQHEQDDQYGMINLANKNNSTYNSSRIHLYEQDTEHRIPFIKSLNSLSTIHLYTKLISSTLSNLLCKLGYSLQYKLGNDEVLAFYNNTTRDFVIFTGVRVIDAVNVNRLFINNILDAKMESNIDVYDIKNLEINNEKLFYVYNKNTPIAVTNSKELFDVLQLVYLYADMNCILK